MDSVGHLGNSPTTLPRHTATSTPRNDSRAAPSPDILQGSVLASGILLDNDDESNQLTDENTVILLPDGAPNLIHADLELEKDNADSAEGTMMNDEPLREETSANNVLENVEPGENENPNENGVDNFAELKQIKRNQAKLDILLTNQQSILDWIQAQNNIQAQAAPLAPDVIVQPVVEDMIPQLPFEDMAQFSAFEQLLNTHREQEQAKQQLKQKVLSLGFVEKDPRQTIRNILPCTFTNEVAKEALWLEEEENRTRMQPTTFLPFL
ncbi:hypothetical protein QAD02_009543 [Eretmocerus hayati]|uniref:Uncharacterized protein n=1 Tax=Eretmocerus hayati TaxID=131215 RepID=A0ACC2N9R6_9HYME|nr:hypothetical protein QAD02_009543 [Eretmocerus hayati]